MWIADQGFWTILIEFQASSHPGLMYQAGTPISLNIGANWLWYPKAHRSFDYGYRTFSTVYEPDAHSMAAMADQLVTRAAEEVGALRRTFHSMSQIARRLVPEERVARWGAYHAAVANGLAGNSSLAQQYFGQILSTPPAHDWERALLAQSKALSACLHAPTDFKSAVMAMVAKSRALLKLPEQTVSFDPT
ncbi:hypothetical protein [Nitrospirillum viridazoti]|uniref:Uncharacterized protein n=1 Tax=Nitrospirillum amazonense TaxID=28077 RepID=A0A560HY76_9PROT|nr:hypothetical protein [Nitrospirillum amazonense]TWB49984.1 hypothetical protein FBZ92_12490 [Nitrospirillum amazonense]